MRQYGFTHSGPTGTDTVNVMGHLNKKYFGLRIEGIVPAPQGLTGYYVFFSFEDLRINRETRNEETIEDER